MINLRKWGSAVLCIFFTQVASSQFSISGHVFDDLDLNGSLTASSNESSLSGITVRAFSQTDALMATATTTTTAGTNYTLSSLAAGNYRLEFSNLPTGYGTTQTGSGIVRFVQITASNVTAVNLPLYYVPGQMSDDPFLYGSHFVQSTSTDGNMGVVFRHRRNGATSGRTQYLSSHANVGDVFGLATSARSSAVFVSAYYRVGTRGVLGGSPGLGKIYVVNAATTYTPPAAAPALLATIIIPDAGTIPASNPAAAVGKIGLGGLATSADGRTLWVVNLNNKKLYRIDISDAAAPGTPVDLGVITAPAALSGRLDDWRPFALKFFRGKLYVGGISSGQTNNTNVTVDGDPFTAGVQIPSASTSNTNNNMYEINDNLTQVATYVMEIANPQTSAVATTVYQQTSMGFPRGRMSVQPNVAQYSRINSRWRAWRDNLVTGAVTGTMSAFVQNEAGVVPAGGTTIGPDYVVWPMPMLTGIEFEQNGSLIFSFRERSMDMGLTYYGSGDVNKACWVSSPTGTANWNGQTGNWFWEGTAGSCNYPIADPGQNSNTEPDVLTNNQPQTREWFLNDYTSLSATTYNHEEQTSGGLAYHPRFKDVAVTTMNPIAGEFTSAGVDFFDAANGAAVNAYRVEVNSDAHRLKKQNALGDIEYMADVAPIELGHRVWHDADGNGIQTGNENGIASVQLQLFADANNDGVPDGAALATVSTSSTGRFAFSSASGTSTASFIYNLALLRNTRYLIRVTNTSWNSSTNTGTGALNGYYLSAANRSSNGIQDLADNDATLVTNLPQISFTTSDYGDLDRSLDFGFGPNTTLSAHELTLSVKKQNGNAVLYWKTEASHVMKEFFVERSAGSGRFEVLATVDAITAQQQYNFTDRDAATAVAYRIRGINQRNQALFSNTVKVDAFFAQGLSLSPNPASNRVQLNLEGAWAAQPGSITITDASGKLIARHAKPVNSNRMVIPIGTLQSGVYQLEIRQPATGNTQTLRFVVNK